MLKYYENKYKNKKFNIINKNMITYDSIFPEIAAKRREEEAIRQREAEAIRQREAEAIRQREEEARIRAEEEARLRDAEREALTAAVRVGDKATAFVGPQVLESDLAAADMTLRRRAEAAALSKGVDARATARQYEMLEETKLQNVVGAMVTSRQRFIESRGGGLLSMLRKADPIDIQMDRMSQDMGFPNYDDAVALIGVHVRTAEWKEKK